MTCRASACHDRECPCALQAGSIDRQPRPFLRGGRCLTYELVAPLVSVSCHVIYICVYIQKHRSWGLRDPTGATSAVQGQYYMHCFRTLHDKSARGGSLDVLGGHRDPCVIPRGLQWSPGRPQGVHGGSLGVPRASQGRQGSQGIPRGPQRVPGIPGGILFVLSRFVSLKTSKDVNRRNHKEP